MKFLEHCIIQCNQITDGRTRLVTIDRTVTLQQFYLSLGRKSSCFEHSTNSWKRVRQPHSLVNFARGDSDFLLAALPSWFDIIFYNKLPDFICLRDARDFSFSAGKL